MKTMVRISFVSLLFIVFACSKADNEVFDAVADPEMEIEPETTEEPNNAPLNFELVGVTDKAVAVDVLPTFSWNPSSDPDGDTLTYDLFLNTGDTANAAIRRKFDGYLF